uniref:Uncharacterized protein n=1 Tax=Lotus japonicus TaxID=34305 RepID=I3TAS3_LOTJA|nr:unknown [Lotus japonicus]
MELLFWFHQFKNWLKKKFQPFHPDTFSLNNRTSWASLNLMLSLRFQWLICRACFLQNLGAQSCLSFTVLVKNGDSSSW